MPELSRFYGIVIKMYFDDHDPPHFHAEYNDAQALIRIDPITLITGRLPPRALALVVEWAALHQVELLRAWSNAKDLELPGKIPPLR